MDVYFTDGTTDCFYTAVFDAYANRDAHIAGRKGFQLSLSDNQISVVTDFDKAERVKKKLLACDAHSLRDIDAMLRSDGKDKEQVALQYIRLLVRCKMPVRSMKANVDVIAAEALLHKVAWEMDKIYGFLRFMETKSGIYYAPYEPDCDITQLIVPHFIARFPSQQFIIHDVKRELAALYNGSDCILTNMPKTDIILSDDESGLQNLWKKYYDSVNIAQRPHEKQMKASMPVRYWKYMSEKQGRR